jgi:S-disulfanyl-L-cysteine oxidoreductase SoxD
MNKTASAILCGGFLLSAMYAAPVVPVAAQATKSANDGVYTAEQAKKGEAIYKEQCAACHGDNLEGAGPMPALAGKDFLANWSAKTIGDLFEKTHTSMPATAPGSLTVEQAAEITAYQLSMSKFPAGTTPLPTTMEALLQIKVDAPK